MKRYADSIARQKRIRPPPGYSTSGSICRAFLEQHSPKKPGSGSAADYGSMAASPAQVSLGESNRAARKRRQGAGATTGTPAHKKAARGRKTGKRKLNGPLANVSRHFAQHDVGGNTPLKIPYGNKEVALALGARYGADGWYSPPGVDLSAFKEKGWL
jgi:DNA topoisomerase-3